MVFNTRTTLAFHLPNWSKGIDRLLEIDYHKLYYQYAIVAYLAGMSDLYAKETALKVMRN